MYKLWLVLALRTEQFLSAIRSLVTTKKRFMVRSCGADEMEEGTPVNFNEQVDEYLDDYYEMESPRFAVMIKGAWGSGKTWFIQRSAERLKLKDGHALYISLYGISTTSGIDDEMFRQLHPRLSSKGMVLAGRIAKGILKGTLKIDLDNDTKEDGSLSVGIPDINFPEYLKNTENHVLIFDDLERCTIPLPELLGYFNYFVEHGGQKLVIIAYEEELIRLHLREEAEINKYEAIKEKLVGKTFEIIPDAQSAVAEFISEARDGIAKNALSKLKVEILSIYESSGYRNLRVLRQMILEFQRITARIPPALWNNEKLVKDLLTSFLVFVIEIRNGTLRPDQILEIRPSMYKIFRSQEDDNTPTLFDIINRKYASYTWLDGPVPEEIWQEYFSCGLVAYEKLTAAIENSSYVKVATEPAWRQLWHFYELSDDELTVLLTDVTALFENNKYTHAGVLQHVVGILLKLSDLGIYKLAPDEIIARAKDNVDALCGSRALVGDFEIFGPMDTGWGGLGYFAQDLPEFKEFSHHLKLKLHEAIIASYPDEARDFLAMLAESPEQAAQSISFTASGGAGKYYSSPIFAYIEVDSFIEAILRLPVGKFKTITGALRYRYKDRPLGDELVSECAWLEQVAHKLEHEVERRKGTITGIRLQYFINDLLNSAQILNPREFQIEGADS
jgi:hypothetical protein